MDEDEIAFMLYLLTWLDEDEDIQDLSDECLSRLAKKWREHWVPGRFAEHNGDCTKMPFTCLRCVMDDLFKNAARIKKVLEEGWTKEKRLLSSTTFGSKETARGLVGHTPTTLEN